MVEIHPSTHQVQVACRGRVRFSDLDRPAGEIYAISFVCGHITVHVDNAEVGHGMSRGQGYCVGAANKHAHLWRLACAKLADLGGP